VALCEECVLVPRTPAPFHDLEFAAQVLGHPIGNLSPEGLILFGKSRVHDMTSAGFESIASALTIADRSDA
jgi:hypothetical protein